MQRAKMTTIFISFIGGLAAALLVEAFLTPDNTRLILGAVMVGIAGLLAYAREMWIQAFRLKDQAAADQSLAEQTWQQSRADREEQVRLAQQASEAQRVSQEALSAAQEVAKGHAEALQSATTARQEAEEAQQQVDELRQQLTEQAQALLDLTHGIVEDTSALASNLGTASTQMSTVAKMCTERATEVSNTADNLENIRAVIQQLVHSLGVAINQAQRAKNSARLMRALRGSSEHAETLLQALTQHQSELRLLAIGFTQTATGMGTSSQGLLDTQTQTQVLLESFHELIEVMNALGLPLECPDQHVGEVEEGT